MPFVPHLLYTHQYCHNLASTSSALIELFDQGAFMITFLRQNFQPVGPVTD
jgi:hypothetical protein